MTIHAIDSMIHLDIVDEGLGIFSECHALMFLFLVGMLVPRRQRSWVVRGPGSA